MFAIIESPKKTWDQNVGCRLFMTQVMSNGFRIPTQEKNVVAICDIDKSTKKAREKRFIGAKGIGFKSVALRAPKSRTMF